MMQTIFACFCVVLVTVGALAFIGIGSWGPKAGLLWYHEVDGSGGECDGDLTAYHEVAWDECAYDTDLWSD